MCTQPRQISAIGVAERVAFEREEPTPTVRQRKSTASSTASPNNPPKYSSEPANAVACNAPGLVGYHIRLAAARTRHTRLVYVTTGILLKELESAPLLPK